MSIIAKEKGGDFKRCPPGTHIAVCNLVADLGLQQTGFGPKHKVYIRFELPHERTEYERDGQKLEGPMTIGANFTVSLSRKATLRGMLESWRGRQFNKEELEGFDLVNVLGAPCQVSVVHETGNNGDMYANIKAIVPLPKGMQRPKAENPLLKYSPDDEADYERLPDWIKEKIRSQLSSTPEDNRQPGADDDFGDGPIPF